MQGCCRLESLSTGFRKNEAQRKECKKWRNCMLGGSRLKPIMYCLRMSENLNGETLNALKVSSLYQNSGKHLDDEMEGFETRTIVQSFYTATETPTTFVPASGYTHS